MFNERTWKEGEKLALEYMKENGYKIKYTNFTLAGVELDIVAVLQAKTQAKSLKQELAKNLKLAQSKAKKQTLKNRYKMQAAELNNLLIVCEVKSRATDKFGLGLCAVDETKQMHLRRGANCLLKRKEFEGMQVRFDVASVDSGKITYIENAF